MPTQEARCWRANYAQPIDVTLGFVSRFVEDARRAVARDILAKRFRPGWADHTYGVFLPKHRWGNPGGYTEYFVQHADGTYSLLDDP